MERVNQYHRVVYAVAKVMVSYEQVLEAEQKNQHNYELLKIYTLNQLNRLSTLASESGDDELTRFTLEYVD